MIGYFAKIRHRYYLAAAAAAIAAMSVAEVPTEIESINRSPGLNSETIKGFAAGNPAAAGAVHDRRIRFAARHKVADPAALVTAVKDSPMANLLISVAIEESKGDPVAVGSAGELGAWQVKASAWGLVPKDIYGQACQAERIITNLMIHTKGNRKKALAHYNGGTTPPVRSYRYAERVLKRTRNLQAAVGHLPGKHSRLRTAQLHVPGNSRIM